MIPPENPCGTLYIVATPIGNLSDISLRAIRTLRSVDYIASEDTRVSGRLLARYRIKSKQISYHDHNEKQKSERIVNLLLDGKSVALISDAGTPLISDPGYRLVNLAQENNIEIVPIPGPSSALAALTVSGFPSDSFCFEGYPPKTPAKLKRFFVNLENEKRTMVLFETPHRIGKTLPVMMDVLGDREIFIARELTKKFEEKIRGKISEIMEYHKNKPLRGEIVVVIRGE